MQDLINNVERMTSIEIAEVTGKPHNDVLKAIRKMEPAWEKVHEGKFSLKQRTIQTSNGATRQVPYYSLTKTECLCTSPPSLMMRHVQSWYSAGSNWRGRTCLCIKKVKR